MLHTCSDLCRTPTFARSCYSWPDLGQHKARSGGADVGAIWVAGLQSVALAAGKMSGWLEFAKERERQSEN